MNNNMNHYMNQEYNIYANQNTQLQQPEYFQHGMPSLNQDRPPPPPPIHYIQSNTNVLDNTYNHHHHHHDQQKVYSFVPLDVVTQKKRPRKKYNEVERLYQCTYQNCTKAYGTLNHLNAHVSMQGHGPKRLPAEFKELRRQLKANRAKNQPPKIRNTVEHDPLSTSMQQQFVPYPSSLLPPPPPPPPLPSNQLHVYPSQHNTYPSQPQHFQMMPPPPPPPPFQ